MGGIDDPADGPAVASTIFVAVLVYVVSGHAMASLTVALSISLEGACQADDSSVPGIPSFLRSARPPAHAREPTRSNCAVEQSMSI